MVALAGPTVSISDSIEQWVALQSAPSSGQGSAVGSFGGRKAQQAKLESGLSKTGPKVGLYKPKLAAILSLEL
jgi:hypothetical protein